MQNHSCDLWPVEIHKMFLFQGLSGKISAKQILTQRYVQIFVSVAKIMLLIGVII